GDRAVDECVVGVLLFEHLDQRVQAGLLAALGPPGEDLDVAAAVPAAAGVVTAATAGCQRQGRCGQPGDLSCVPHWCLLHCSSLDGGSFYGGSFYGGSFYGGPFYGGPGDGGLCRMTHVIPHAGGSEPAPRLAVRWSRVTSRVGMVTVRG